MKTSDKFILVTGGAGYIGSHVVKQLSEAGKKVLVLDDLSTGFKDSLIHNEILINSDIGDVSTLSKIFCNYNIDTVFHFAAKVVVSDSIHQPIVYFENNTGKLINLLKICFKYRVKNFIFSSTAAVYGNSNDQMVTEDSPPNPINPYSASKLMSEQIIRLSSEVNNMKYVILRYFNVAGAEPHLRIGQKTKSATHLIKVACETALKIRESMYVYGSDYKTSDGTGVRDYIHVEDLAYAHTLALQYLEDGGTSDIFNCGYGRGYSVLEVIKEVEKCSNLKVNYNFSSRRPGDIPALIANAQKIRRILHWTPKYDSLNAIVQTAFDWESKMNKICVSYDGGQNEI